MPGALVNAPRTGIPMTEAEMVNTSMRLRHRQPGLLANLALAGVAGAVGASSVYPLDLAKTRLQNQRGVASGIQYRGLGHCLLSMARAEGLLGLYRGLPTQLVGIIPEKAIKLVVNDTLRTRFSPTRDPDHVPWYGALAAGAAAGGLQFVATSPYELTKIRVQLEGVRAAADPSYKPKSALRIVRDLGLRGLFTGSSATLLRDIPFTACYFTLYGYTKELVRPEGQEFRDLHMLRRLAAGTMAGVVCSGLITPADVIKTRLQAEVRPGDTAYTGIRQCARRILAEEGVGALFKGAVPRMILISPLFGVAMMTYETLQQFFFP